MSAADASVTTVLLAEDHTLVREGLKMLLSIEPGLQVVAETGDGRAVESMVRSVMPGLLVLDLDLPGRHGVDIAIAVKAEFSAGVKVLVLTGDLRPDSVGRALAAGADGYVLKSEDTEELLIAVRAVLAGREYVSKSIAHAFRSNTFGTASSDAMRRNSELAPSAATPREREIMSLVARGLSNNDIAGVLGISVLTVRTHRQNLMEKFELRNAAEITAYAVKHGFYDPS